MKSAKLDKSKDTLSNIKQLLQPGSEEILHTFQVVPIDYKVKDFASPKIFLTQTKFIFTYDEIAEIYDLTELEIDVIGAPPRFTLWELILEGSYLYSSENEDQLRNIRTDEVLTRISISQPNSVSKDFILRSGAQVEKSYKTWAAGRIIMNTKLGLAPNKMLAEMVSGYFSVLNQRTVLAFIASFVGYFVLKPVVLNFLPDFANTAVDLLFVVVLGFMSWWLYTTATNNLNRFKTLYLSYKA
jgi:hypothetical protein